MTIIPLVSPFVLVTFTAATTFGITRYRVPAEVALCMLAAWGWPGPGTPRRSVSSRRFLGPAGAPLLGMRWFWILEMRPECRSGRGRTAGVPGYHGQANVSTLRCLHEVGTCWPTASLHRPVPYASTGEERPSAHGCRCSRCLGVVSALGGQGVDTHRLHRPPQRAHVAVLGLIGRDLLGWRAGLIAAAIEALYPNLWINDFLLQVSLATLLIALDPGRLDTGETPPDGASPCWAS